MVLVGPHSLLVQVISSDILINISIYVLIKDRIFILADLSAKVK